ncbi:MAG TPA: RES family NAD+ phosphorylase [Woeseiaceae bacterium]
MIGRESEYRLTRDSQRDWHRNIVSLRRSVDVFADLVDDPDDAEVLARHELATKPLSRQPAIITRPFEEADVYDSIASAIEWPFEHPCRSRFSDGTFGVWYGASSLETSIRETVHHFRVGTLASAVAAQSPKPIIQERRVHLVHCSALLVDLRALVRKEPRLLHLHDYTTCQMLGAELKNAGMPGVLTYSVRHAKAEVAAVFLPSVLADPRTVCYLTYTLFADTGRVIVERTPGVIELDLPA